MDFSRTGVQFVGFAVLCFAQQELELLVVLTDLRFVEVVAVLVENVMIEVGVGT